MEAARRYRGLGVAAGLGLVLSGCAPGAPADEPCLDPAGRLIAHVNNDEYPDAVTGTEGIGEELRIAFGEESGFGEPRAPRDLVGFIHRYQDDFYAAVADFDGDGWLDLAIAASEEITGDSPGRSPVTELRMGPISGWGRGQETHSLLEVHMRGLRAVDYDGNNRPDLALHGYEGDGSYAVRGYEGDQEEGLSYRNEHYEMYAPGWAEDDLPPPLDMDGFYPACGA
ncbi:VCBS repeat-containing protein [Nocardiopsis sp. ARC36]